MLGNPSAHTNVLDMFRRFHQSDQSQHHQPQGACSTTSNRSLPPLMRTHSSKRLNSPASCRKGNVDNHSHAAQQMYQLGLDTRKLCASKWNNHAEQENYRDFTSLDHIVFKSSRRADGGEEDELECSLDFPTLNAIPFPDESSTEKFRIKIRFGVEDGPLPTARSSEADFDLELGDGDEEAAVGYMKSLGNTFDFEEDFLSLDTVPSSRANTPAESPLKLPLIKLNNSSNKSCPPRPTIFGAKSDQFVRPGTSWGPRNEKLAVLQRYF